MRRKKNTEDLDFFFGGLYTKEKTTQGVIIMLKKFSVENFKGFKDKITLDIGSPSNYGFHPEIIEGNCITKGIIYGINGCGKSNLGLAIFDVITHLTEKQKLLQSYDFYLNMSGRKSFAEFEYTFVFDGHELVYKYSKTDVDAFASGFNAFNHLFPFVEVCFFCIYSEFSANYRREV